MIRRLVIARMNAWHRSPHGGRCPRTDGPQCSRRGVELVARYGAVVGTIAAARYVAACRVEDDKSAPCQFGRPDPGRWATLRVLVLFARLAVLHTPSANPGRPCSDDDG